MWHRCIEKEMIPMEGLNVNGKTENLKSLDETIKQGDFVSLRNNTKTTKPKYINSYSRYFDSVELSDGTVFGVVGSSYSNLTGFLGYYTSDEFIISSMASPSNSETGVGYYPVKILRINDSLFYSISLSGSGKPVLYRWIVNDGSISPLKLGYLVNSKLLNCTNTFRQNLNKLSDGKLIYVYDACETNDSGKVRNFYAVIISITSEGALNIESETLIGSIDKESSCRSISVYELAADKFCMCTSDGNYTYRAVAFRYSNGVVEYGSMHNCTGVYLNNKAINCYLISETSFMIFNPDSAYNVPSHYATLFETEGLEIKSVRVQKIPSSLFSTDSYCDVVEINGERFLKVIKYERGYYLVYYRITLDGDNNVTLEEVFNFNGKMEYTYNYWSSEHYTEDMFFLLSPFEVRQLAYAAIPMKNGVVVDGDFVESYSEKIYGVAASDCSNGSLDVIIPE